MVGIASGFYSSIFIASPVLTAWKEREPQYRNRREVLTEAMGYVPPFPEENVVERVEEGRFEGDRPEGEEPAVVEEEPKPREPEPEVASPAAAGDGAPGDGAPEQPAADELVGAGSEQRQPKPERRQQQKRRQQRRRRKHGRHR
jgi:hypothetical protein